MVIHSRQSRTERYIRNNAQSELLKQFYLGLETTEAGRGKKKPGQVFCFFLVHLLFLLLLFVCSLFLCTFTLSSLEGWVLGG